MLVSVIDHRQVVAHADTQPLVGVVGRSLTVSGGPLLGGVGTTTLDQAGVRCVQVAIGLWGTAWNDVFTVGPAGYVFHRCGAGW